MNFKLNLVYFLFFLIYQSLASNNDEYFAKSIFRALKEKNGQFESEINYTIYKMNFHTEEKYNFKLNSGQYIEKTKFSNYSDRIVYLNSSQIYLIDYFNECFSYFLNESIYRFNWPSKYLYDNQKFNYNILGSCKSFK